MKIIHIITAFGIGGAEKLLVNIINRQIEQHSVYLIYFKNITDLISELDEKVRIKQIPLSFGMVKQLKKMYKEIKPDVIHTHLGHADLIGGWSARNIPVKFFSTMHSTHFKKNGMDAIFFKIYSFLFLKIMKKGQIIAISKSVKKQIISKIKLPKERVHLLYNAISLKKIDTINSNYDKSSEKIRLLFVGRLEKAKSIDTLIKAISILNKKKLQNEFELDIIGDGSLRASLEQLTVDLQLQHIINFKGKQKQVERYYSQSDVFILPSIFEGFGITILEAFNARIAIITSNIQTLAELIYHKENGLLFETRNYVDLANKIAVLINDSVYREKIAQKGYETLSRKYEINTYVKKLHILYDQARV